MFSDKQKYVWATYTGTWTGFRQDGRLLGLKMRLMGFKSMAEDQNSKILERTGSVVCCRLLRSAYAVLSPSWRATQDGGAAESEKVNQGVG